MIRMPWTNASAPNVMIEIVDTCNVSCKVCYRNLFNNKRSLNEIKKDLDDALKLRKLHTVTISGGEPTLHPELCEVIRMIKGKGLHAFLLTNGLLIDEDYLARLKNAGLDAILFHVDIGQRRRDLPLDPTFADVSKRLDKLINMAAARGLDVSISTILYEDGQEEAISEYFFDNRLATFLFLSKAVPCRTFFHQSSDAEDVARGRPSTQRLVDFFRHKHDIEPYSCIPTEDGQDSVWISYFVPVVYGEKGYRTLTYHSNWMDVAMMRIVKGLSGRYIHKTRQNKTMTSIRIFLNAASRFRPFSALSFWMHSLKRGHELRHKTIVYDDGPYHVNDGSVQDCEYCPTAIVRNGALVPCCTADFTPEVVSA